MCCGIGPARNNRFVINIAAQRAYAERVRITAILKYDTAPRRFAKKPSSAPNNAIIIQRGSILRCLLFRLSEKAGGTGASLQTKIRSLRRDDGSQLRRRCVVMRGAAFAVRYAAITRGSP